MTGEQVDARVNATESATSSADVQSGVQPDAVIDAPSAPFPQLATSGRDAYGRFLLGNQEATTHGAYRNTDRPALRTLIDAEREAAISALGGMDQITPQLSRVIDSYAANCVLWEAALTKVLEGGLVTSRGNTRAIFRVWQQLDEALTRKATLLGLERRQKAVSDVAQALSGVSR